jgi:2-oxoglutarate ferredoxin oxidoreductase subunit gamma
MMTKLLLAGDGGQGVQTLALLLARAAVRQGNYSSYIPNFGLEQRGGVSLGFVIISHKPITYPKFKDPDLVLGMSPQADERTFLYQEAAQWVIRWEDYADVFKDNAIGESNRNVFFLGLISAALSAKKWVTIESVRLVLEDKLANKTGWTANQKAFLSGVKHFNN